jgi:hypothetical protein
VRRRGLIGVGVLLLLGGLAAGGVIFVLSPKVVENTVQHFSRAPVGCMTTLDFTKKAVFTIYVETKGVALDVGGDCAGNGRSYDRSPATPPTVTLSLVDSKGIAVPMADSTRFSYSTGDYRGTAVQQVTIATTGTYNLTVQSKDSDFAIAIGGDPDADARRMKYIGATAVAAGLLLGVLLILLGMRRRTPPPPAADDGQMFAERAPATPLVPHAPMQPVPFQVPTTPPGTPSPGASLPPPSPPGMPGMPGGWGTTR